MNFNDSIIEEFRSNHGKVSGGFKDSNILLLTTTGAKTGKLHTTPLVYSMDVDKYVIVASKGGSDHNPDWFHNVVAKPEVSVEVGDDKINVKAEIADEATRQKLYAKHSEQYPGFLEYQKQTHRKIPVILLQRIS